MTDTSGSLPPLPASTDSTSTTSTTFLPDTRGWFLIGSFALVTFLLSMIRENPRLLANASFMQIATVIVGLLVAIGANLFGGTKVGSETMAAQSQAIVKNATPTVLQSPPVDSVTTTTVKTA